MDLDSWMSTLPDIIKNKPINHIIMPGTHDSCAYKLNHNVNFNNKLYKYLNFASRHSSFIRNIVNDWTLTQKMSIYDQLMNGIRCLDIRVSYDRKDDMVYTSHTFCSIPLMKVLSDINMFIKHRQEVVIVDINPDWNNRESLTPEINDNIINLVNTLLGKSLCKASDNFRTLQEMIDNNEKIMLYYGGKYINTYDFIWPSVYLYNPWDNTSNLSIKKQMLDKDLSQINYNHMMNCIGLNLTPNDHSITRDVVKRIFLPLCYQHQSVQSYSEIMGDYYGDFIRTHYDKLPCISRLTFDFPTNEEISNVILLNYKFKDTIQ